MIKYKKFFKLHDENEGRIAEIHIGFLTILLVIMTPLTLILYYWGYL